ncbi:MAG: hypothetical protein WAN05_15475, partial [Roseiarcus sp.]
MTTADPFDSPCLTLERAKHHIRDLKQVIQAFKNEQTQPWSYEIDTDSQPPNTVYKIRFHKLPPSDATCILFDAVNNLRATLDQIGYSAAIASGKIKPERTKFLFGNDVKDPSKWKSTGLPAEIVDLFRSVEPYEGGNGQRLWAVNRLCNLKKHSQLVPTRITGAVARFGAYFPDFTAAVTGFGGSNWMTNEHEFILMVRPPGEPDLNITGNFDFTVSVDAVDFIRDQPIVGVLEGAAGSVADLLVSAEAICQRADWG